MDALRRFIRDDEAPTAIEYAIMLGGIATVIIATVALLGSNVSSFFASVSTKMTR